MHVLYLCTVVYIYNMHVFDYRDTVMRLLASLDPEGTQQSAFVVEYTLIRYKELFGLLAFKSHSFQRDQISYGTPAITIWDMHSWMH